MSKVKKTPFELVEKAARQMANCECHPHQKEWTLVLHLLSKMAKNNDVGIYHYIAAYAYDKGYYPLK